MIHVVAASDPRYKDIALTAGLNVILAERTETSSDQQTRNSSGKSSFVRVLHFLLGANAISLFKSAEIRDWTFALGMDLPEEQVIVARSGADSSKHHILSSSSGYETLPLSHWKKRLATAWFPLPKTMDKYPPTYRAIISYLVREANDGGMSNAFANSSKQQQWNSQITLSYLLGLDWRIPAQLEVNRDEEKRIAALIKAAHGGELGPAIGTAAEIRTQLAVRRDEANTTRRQIESFKVLDQYHELQSEADALTLELRNLRELDAIDRDLVADLSNAISDEAPPGVGDLERVWEQVNVLLPEIVRNSYEDVYRFHESVIANRSHYLEQERVAARQRIEERERNRERVTLRRSEILGVLESGGALEQFGGLQAELGHQEGLVTVLNERLGVAEKIEVGNTQAERRRQDLFLRLQEDYHDRTDSLSKAISLFERYSRRLYDDRRGSLIVEPSPGGPKFRVDISGSGSVGIDSMQILCFDLVLITLLQERGEGPGFLVHDSHIFDGVDERQIANALALGADLAKSLKFQYIVTMNSDDVPTSFPPGFDFWSHVNGVRLTDEREDGGLFGLRMP
jgi:uncharacterized protein YydD (DUF2326 family)